MEIPKSDKMVLHRKTYHDILKRSVEICILFQKN